MQSGNTYDLYQSAMAAEALALTVEEHWRNGMAEWDDVKSAWQSAQKAKAKYRKACAQPIGS